MMIYGPSSQSCEASTKAKSYFRCQPHASDTLTGSASLTVRASLTGGVSESRIGLKAKRLQDLGANC